MAEFADSCRRFNGLFPSAKEFMRTDTNPATSVQLVADLKARKHAAEAAIRAAVASFVADTQLPVSGVRIDMVDVTTCGMGRRYEVGDVRVEVEL